MGEHLPDPDAVKRFTQLLKGCKPTVDKWQSARDEWLASLDEIDDQPNEETNGNRSSD